MSRSRRPTIILANWVFSVDLQGTREVQNQPGVPAYSCSCDACEAWRENYASNLPEALLIALKRIGINLSQPTECYGQKTTENTFDLRVLFHFVGKNTIRT